MVKGTYSSETPTYIFITKIDGEETFIAVNASNMKCIVSLNPDDKQIDILETYQNLG